MKNFIEIIFKFVLVCLMVFLFALGITGFSPVFDFEEKRPFCGNCIFNPYRNIDTTITWKKANFHTHTRIKGPLNECPEWPDKVLERYDTLGYDIVVFSNHNAFTAGDNRPDEVKINAYEHGYNLCQFHKLVFGSESIDRFDNLLPLLASQCQWQLDKLGKNAMFIQFNHPARYRGISKNKMEKLSGYDIIEFNTALSDTEHRYWDWALSAGHYSFVLSNDDLHKSDVSDCIAKRCNFLNCSSARVEDVLKCLGDGCFYCVQMPDFGNGDWHVKAEMNRRLPRILNIGTTQDSIIFITLDRPASQIIFTGQDGQTLQLNDSCDKADYTMKADDTYARITCHFNDGTVLYTNAFARYDKTNAATPFSESPHPVNMPLSILWNLFMVLVCAGSATAAVKVIKA